MALKKLKPPTYRADALGTFVSVYDDAWDDDLYNADLQLLMDAALRKKQEAGGDTTLRLTPEETEAAAELHPVRRYATGKTRFQLDAPDHAPDGSSCTVRSRYLTKGVASEFTIRRLGYPTCQALEEIAGTDARMTAFARAGLRAIRSPGFTWEAEDEQQRAPENVIQSLYNSDPSLPVLLGLAVMQLSRGLNEEETFP